MRPKWGPLLSIHRHVAVYDLIKRNRLICEDIRVPRDKRKGIGSHRKSVLSSFSSQNESLSAQNVSIATRKASKPSYATRIEHGGRERGPHLPPERFPPLFDALANAHLHVNNLDIQRLRLDDDFGRFSSVFSRRDVAIKSLARVINVIKIPYNNRNNLRYLLNKKTPNHGKENAKLNAHQNNQRNAQPKTFTKNRLNTPINKIITKGHDS